MTLCVPPPYPRPNQAPLSALAELEAGLRLGASAYPLSTAPSIVIGPPREEDRCVREQRPTHRHLLAHLPPPAALQAQEDAGARPGRDPGAQQLQANTQSGLHHPSGDRRQGEWLVPGTHIQGKGAHGRWSRPCTKDPAPTRARLHGCRSWTFTCSSGPISMSS